MKLQSGLTLADICRGLGIDPQFLADVSTDASKYYSTFEIPKRSGGVRTICASQGRLKRMQRLLLQGLLERYPMPDQRPRLYKTSLCSYQCEQPYQQRVSHHFRSN